MKSLTIPIPHIRKLPLEEMRQYVRKCTVQKAKRQKKLRLKRVCKRYSETNRLLVVLLRYGSLTDFSRLRNGWADI